MTLPTRPEMAKYLADHGWRKLPRKPGRRLAWESPCTTQSWPTDIAYEIALAWHGKTVTAVHVRTGGGR